MLDAPKTQRCMMRTEDNHRCQGEGPMRSWNGLGPHYICDEHWKAMEYPGGVKLEDWESNLWYRDWAGNFCYDRFMGRCTPNPRKEDNDD